MSSRRGSSRTVGVKKQCAVYVRGGLRCVHCQRKLRAPRTDGGKNTCTASIDHWNGDGRDHRPENLVPSCRRCNELRPWPDLWSAHLRKFKTTPEEARARALAQLEEPLDLKAGEELAVQWHHGRLEKCREYRRRWADRKAGKIPSVVEAISFGEAVIGG